MDEPLTEERADAVETSHEAKAAVMVRCVHCGDEMFRDELARFSRGFGITVLVIGLLLSVFMSLLFGLPLVVIGAYMGFASRPVWTCQGCGVMVDRNGV